MEIKLVLKLVCCVAIFNYFLIRVVIGGKNSFNAIVLLLHFFPLRVVIGGKNSFNAIALILHFSFSKSSFLYLPSPCGRVAIFNYFPIRVVIGGKK